MFAYLYKAPIHNTYTLYYMHTHTYMATHTCIYIYSYIYYIIHIHIYMAPPRSTPCFRWYLPHTLPYTYSQLRVLVHHIAKGFCQKKTLPHFPELREF